MVALAAIKLRDILLGQGHSLALMMRHQHLPADFSERETRTATRSALRLVLSQVTAIPLEQLRFEKTSQGKPYLVSDNAVSFNVSHSEGHSLIALSRRGAVGCDIEDRFQSDDVHRLGPLILHGAEVDAMERLAGQALQDAFMRCWVRKEAVLKALGTGFGADPRCVMVGFEDEPSVWRGLESLQLSVHDRIVTAACKAAVASEDPMCYWYAFEP